MIMMHIHDSSLSFSSISLSISLSFSPFFLSLSFSSISLSLSLLLSLFSLKVTGEVVIPPERDQSMLKKAVTHLVDHVHLFTTNYKVHVILQVNY